MTLETHYIGGDGLRLAADVLGEIGNPPVIFLHGGGQTRWSWGGSAREMAQQGYYVISLDARGHGGSGWAGTGHYEIEDFVADLHAVTATLQQLPILIGASLGGLTALMAVGESATPCATALVLVDVAPRIDPKGAEHIGQFMNANRDGFATVDEAADAVAAYIPHRPRPTNTDGLKKNLRRGQDGRLYWHWDPDFLNGQGLHQHPIADHSRLSNAARKITIPTLLIRGGNSEIVSEEGARELLELIPGSECVELAGAHHMVAGDSNDRFSDSVLHFLKRRLGGGQQ